MERSAESRSSSTSPVVVAVIVTLVVCVLGHFAYNHFVLERGLATAPERSAGGLGAHAAAVASTPPQASGQNREMAAAVIRALATANADERREDCPPPPAPREADERAPDDRDAEGTSERAARFMEGNVETLEAEFRDEKVDTDWAKQTEEAATRTVAKMTSGMRLEEVKCRATLCRARVTHADPSMRGNDLMQLLGAPEMSAQMLPYAPAEDEPTTVIYFARQGHTLSVLSAGPPSPTAISSAGH
jgi:hypothetical protein